MPAHQEALEGFSERLRRVIEREEGRGKKQAFARKIGVKPQQLSRYLHGRIPHVPTLLAIAEAGQVSVDWLLRGREALGIFRVLDELEKYGIKPTTGTGIMRRRQHEATPP